MSETAVDSYELTCFGNLERNAFMSARNWSFVRTVRDVTPEIYVEVEVMVFVS